MSQRLHKILLSAAVMLGFAGYAIRQKPSAPSVPASAGLAEPMTTANRPSLLSRLFQEDDEAGETGNLPVQPLRPAAGTSSQPATAQGAFTDGTYTGPVTDAFYGSVQVKTVITGGRLADVQFLQYPNDRRTSVSINQQAMPMLKQQAIQAQSAAVNGVSGASQTSRAFRQSLAAALAKAKP